MLKEILNRYNENEFITIDGFDDAIIGVNESNMTLIYSVKKCLEILMQDMDSDEALEYFYHNLYNSFNYDKQLMFCDDNFIY